MKIVSPRSALILAWMMIGTLSGLAKERPAGSMEEIANVQQHLNPGEALLEYTLTDSSIQILAIAGESTYFTNQSADRLFWCSLNSFQKKLKSAEPRDFLIQAEILYLFLIEPVRVFLTGKHRLIIIPGKRLIGLPFEAFIRSDHVSSFYNVCDLHYLIHDFEVVYQSSMKCLNEKCKTKESIPSITPGDNQFAFIGFSPVFNQNQQHTALPGSRNEIMAIGALFRQKGLSSWLVSDEFSNKDYFMKMACRGRIVHLATHYIPDKSGNKAGGFLFSGYLPAAGQNQPEGLLTTGELRVLQLDADLIVLNACASAVDGITSGAACYTLSQLLAMAGARNIISTLWNVTDHLAAGFMLDFYRLLLSGKTYSEALREVKLQWISCSETAIPTIWAPYILVGD
ncbi:MAG: CHAT domain-containing protein [Bacteroidales bacterium]|nr:CHAT domain-containing protein [Bacteroidales bacterium]